MPTHKTCLRRFLVSILVPMIFAVAPASTQAQLLPFQLPDIQRLVTTSGSVSVIPVDTWGSGDFDAFTDEFFGYATPRLNKLSIDMDQTATTTYQGDLFFKKLRLKVGLNVDVDNNFVGKLNHLMGYVNYEGFELRVQTSTLRGTTVWSGATVPTMPTRSSFDNPFVSVDLLRYSGGMNGLSYWGAGYTSYRIPVQFDCLIYDTARGEVWWGDNPVYQPDLAFQIYSLLLGLDTFHAAFAGTSSMLAKDGPGVWMATQDRVGVGVSKISDEATSWVEAANGGRKLWSARQIAMLVDYDLTLGAQWIGNVRPVRLAIGLGFNVGGQVVTCVTPRGPVKAGYVDASPSVYLYHYGPILKGAISW
jgi:hypothetical protein